MLLLKQRPVHLLKAEGCIAKLKLLLLVLLSLLYSLVLPGRNRCRRC